MAHPRIDLVFTYVDGSDPAHAARRREWRQALPDTPPEVRTWYRGVGELTYAVRSALSAMPWIGTIHVVTDGQRPPVDDALIESGRLRVVDHSAIVPAQYRPVFASTIIESFLHRIPGLSEIWLYDNDDFLHGNAIEPGEFCEWTPDRGLRLKLRTVPALVRIALGTAAHWSPPPVPRANIYSSGIVNSARLLHRRCGISWRAVVFPRHVTQVYRSATARRLEEVLAEDLHEARMRHVRSRRQLSWSTLAYSAECAWHGALQCRYAPSLRERDELFVDFNRILGAGQLARTWTRIRTTRAKFICLNNIPESQSAEFRDAMACRGLTRPARDEAVVAAVAC